MKQKIEGGKKICTCECHFPGQAHYGIDFHCNKCPIGCGGCDCNLHGGYTCEVHGANSLNFKPEKIDLLSGKEMSDLSDKGLFPLGTKVNYVIRIINSIIDTNK